MSTQRDQVVEHEAEIRALKRVLRKRWDKPMADEQRRHRVLKKRATELYIAIASSRGRMHIRPKPDVTTSEATPCTP